MTVLTLVPPALHPEPAPQYRRGKLIRTSTAAVPARFIQAFSETGYSWPDGRMWVPGPLPGQQVLVETGRHYGLTEILDAFDGLRIGLLPDRVSAVVHDGVPAEVVS